MRCPSCQNYIPSGLAEGTPCPSCGANLSTVESTVKGTLEKPKRAETLSETLAETTVEKVSNALPFAPYFTIRTAVALADATPSQGSLSFGADGFSVVTDQGRKLEKFLYRNLRLPTLHDRGVMLDLDGSKQNLTFASGKRAEAFLELLSRVRDGLSAEELAKFKSRLEK